MLKRNSRDGDCIRGDGYGSGHGICAGFGYSYFPGFANGCGLGNGWCQGDGSGFAEGEYMCPKADV